MKGAEGRLLPLPLLLLLLTSKTYKLQMWGLWATDVTHLGLKHRIRSSHAMLCHSLSPAARSPPVTQLQEDVGV